MNLLVVGGGGREHAIIKKLKENKDVETIYALPGNGGIAADADMASNVVVYHAGDKLENGQLVTSGGRVLGVTATASSLKEALKDAYEAAETIQFEGKYMRHDIGKRALEVLEG